MAHSKNNVITRTYSGKIGNVCMQRDGVIRSLPAGKRKVWSKKQKNHLSRFELAKQYGRQVLADPCLTAHYAVYKKRWKRKLKNTGVWQLAIRDFMNPPGIWGVDLVRPGLNNAGMICIHAHDKFEIKGVRATLLAPGGNLLAEGEAILVLSLGRYVYEIQDPLLMKPGVTCRVRVWDVPGNVTEKEVNLFE